MKSYEGSKNCNRTDSFIPFILLSLFYSNERERAKCFLNKKQRLRKTYRIINTQTYISHFWCACSIITTRREERRRTTRVEQKRNEKSSKSKLAIMLACSSFTMPFIECGGGAAAVLQEPLSPLSLYSPSIGSESCSIEERLQHTKNQLKNLKKRKWLWRPATRIKILYY